MRLTPKEPDIKIGKDGFAEHDQLGRKDTGDKLSRLVENLESPTVIALDGSWGSGKSFFLKCWCGEHMKKENGNKAEVIYFDAFEHDFLDDPLIALTGAISRQIEGDKDRSKIWKTAKKWAPRIGRAAGKFAIGAALAELIPSSDEDISDTTKKISSELEEGFDKAADDFWKREDGKLQAMAGFRKALTALTEPDDDGIPTKKLVIIIDELDRCRPDYALSMLEVMKHFFAVDGVHFVLGVNLKELENSVKARYGQGIKAGQYLQKFVHVKMPIEKPRTDFGDPSDYSLYFNNVVAELGIGKHNTYVHHVKNLLTMVNYHNKISLRDVERIITLCAVTGAISGFEEYEATLMAGLIIFSICEPKFIEAARRGTLQYKDVQHYFLLDDRESSTGFFTKVRVVWKAATTAKNEYYNFTDGDRQAFEKMPSRGKIQGCLPGLISDYLDAFRLP